MMQDWTWYCAGCGKRIEPYEIHDTAKCCEAHGKKVPDDIGATGPVVSPAQRDMTPDERAEMERLTANLDADVDSALLSSPAECK